MDDISREKRHEGVFGNCLNQLHTVERKLGLETQGVYRVDEQERSITKIWKMGEFWMYTNISLPTFSSGILGPILGLSLNATIVCICVTSLLASLVPAVLSVFGARFGLRQIISCRFSCGWVGTLILAILDTLTSLGWQVVNNVAAGQALSAVFNRKFGPEIGIIISSLVSLVFGFLGYRYIVHWQRFMAILALLGFAGVAGSSGKDWTTRTVADVAPYTAQNVLSYIGCIVGFIFGWAPMASDWSCYCKSDIKGFRLFFWTYIGLIIPIILLQCLGAVISSLAMNAQIPLYNTLYNESELGGLFLASVDRVGKVGKFFIFLIVLSTVSANVVNLYSVMMSFQIVHRKVKEMPQCLFAILGTVIILPVSIAAAYSFAAALNTFMNVIVVWLSIYCTIYLTEHFVIRKGNFSSYNLEIWDSRRRLHTGWAAIITGVIVATVLVAFNVKVNFSTEPIYASSLELGIGFTLVVYTIARTIEVRYIGLSEPEENSSVKDEDEEKTIATEEKQIT